MFIPLETMQRGYVVKLCPFCFLILISSAASAAAAAEVAAVVEEFHVAVLHVLLVLAHGLLRISLAREEDVCLSVGLPLRVVLELDVDGVAHRAEPLGDVVRRRPERQPAHPHDVVPAAAATAVSAAAPETAAASSETSAKAAVSVAVVGKTFHGPAA